MDTTLEDDYEALIQFLYIAPIGLVQTRIDGEILMVNPLCAQLLMPLARNGELSNLYKALESVAPDLRTAVQSFEGAHGMVCDGWQLRVPADPPGKLKHTILSLTLLKLDEGRLMAVLGDVTHSVQRERELRQSQAWINSIVTGLTDYALMTLDDQGRVRDWNKSVQRLTAHSSDACVGQSYAIFYPPDALGSVGAVDRLRNQGLGVGEHGRARGRLRRVHREQVHRHAAEHGRMAGEAAEIAVGVADVDDRHIGVARGHKGCAIADRLARADAAALDDPGFGEDHLRDVPHCLVAWNAAVKREAGAGQVEGIVAAEADACRIRQTAALGKDVERRERRTLRAVHRTVIIGTGEMAHQRIDLQAH